LGATPDDAVEDVGARDVAGARHVDDLPDLGATERALFGLGLDLPADHALHVLDQFVDDPVVLERDALAFGRLDDAAWGADAEGEDRGVGGARQQQVGLGGTADFGEHDLDVDLFGRFAFAQQHAFDGLERALGVGAQEQVDGLGLGLAEQVGEGEALAADRLVGGVDALLDAALRHLLGLGLGLDALDDGAGDRLFGEAEHLHGHRGTGFGDVGA